ncbi:Hypothetical protein SynRCC307_1918 [Synechococcus sp. RCC307]|nr:Hypothetical protein SynRCC307_1918 [Synechococcus sp. RCC307]
MDQALAEGASATAEGFNDDVSTTFKIKEVTQIVNEIKDGDPKKLSQSIDKIADNFTANAWSTGKRFLDSTKLTNLQKTQEDAVKSFQKGDIAGGIEKTLNLNPPQQRGDEDH